MSKKRISWLDIAKSIAMFCILMSHTLKEGEFRTYLFSFNVIIFFFLSGLTFKQSVPFAQFIRKIAIHIMIPYYVWGTISIFVYMLMGKTVMGNIATAKSEYDFSFINNLYGLFYASPEYNMKWNIPLWFLPCLAANKLLHYLIGVISKKNYSKILFAITIAILGLSLKPFILPFNVDVAMVMLAVTVFGEICRDKFLVLSEKVKDKPVCSTLIALILLYAAILLRYNCGPIDVKSKVYGVLYYTIPSVTMSILGILLISMVINKNWLLEKIGRSTLSILCMHKFIILFFQTILPVTRKLLSKNDILTTVIVCMITIVGILIVDEIYYVLLKKVSLTLKHKERSADVIKS